MKRFSPIWLNLGLLLFGTGSVWAQTPKYANAFLDVGVGARGIAMSQAVVASANDATAAFWNPAGLTDMRRDIQFGFMHHEHFAGIVKFDYGGLAVKFSEKDAGAFTFIRSGVDDIPNTLELLDANGNVDYDRVQSFSAADYAFLLSYARKLDRKNRWSLGGSAKVIHRHIGGFGTGWGFGIDLGLKFQHNNWSAAAMFRDASSTITQFKYSTDAFRVIFIETGNEVISSSTEIAVPRMTVGGAYALHIKDKFLVRPELQFTVTTDGRRNVLLATDAVSVDPAFGLELGYNDLIFIRGGIGRFQYLKNPSPDGGFEGQSLSFLPTAGLGLQIKALSLDYTLANFGTSLVGLSHVFSLRLDLFKASNLPSDNKTKSP
ncbi:MAG: PorV/PorQ family protein [Bacteroidetes bacterium]|jgi:hypothetical protein|nr:PorV/PorQ family protein [Bacteroidota bacterium]